MPEDHLKNASQNPKLNPTLSSSNTPFLTIFFNSKEYYGNILTSLRYIYVTFIKAA